MVFRNAVWMCKRDIRARFLDRFIERAVAFCLPEQDLLMQYGFENVAFPALLQHFSDLSVVACRGGRVVRMQ